MVLFLSILIILGALALSILANLLLRKAARRYNVFLVKGVPVVGGFGIWIAFALAAQWGGSALKISALGIPAVLVASFAMLVFGILDDQKELSVTSKLLTQIFSVTLLMYFGIKTQVVYLGPFLNAFITLIWVVGIVNAFNHLDISDGVAAVLGILASLAFLVISIINRDQSNLVISLALLGALSGFLVFNFPPAKIYMGNAGSHCLGFVLAAVAIAISYAPLEKKTALFSPILILGLPALDTAFLILVRLSKKKIPFQKSNDHIILRLKALGYSPRRIFLVMALWGLFFIASGIAVSQFSNLWGLFTVMLAGIFSFKIIAMISKVSVKD